MVTIGREEDKQTQLDLIGEVTWELAQRRSYLHRLMRTARANGCSLSEIGDALGVSKQSVHETLLRHPAKH